MYKFLAVLCTILSIAYASNDAIRFEPQIFVRDWPASSNLSLFSYVAEQDRSFQYYDTGRLIDQDRSHGK